MKLIDKMDPNAFSLLATLLGLLISFSLDSDEQNAFGNFLLSAGQSILTKVSQIENVKAHASNDAISRQIEAISRQLDELKKQLRN